MKINRKGEKLMEARDSVFIKAWCLARWQHPWLVGIAGPVYKRSWISLRCHASCRCKLLLFISFTKEAERFPLLANPAPHWEEGLTPRRQDTSELRVTSLLILHPMYLMLVTLNDNIRPPTNAQEMFGKLLLANFSRKETCASWCLTFDKVDFLAFMLFLEDGVYITVVHTRKHKAGEHVRELVMVVFLNTTATCLQFCVENYAVRAYRISHSSPNSFSAQRFLQILIGDVRPISEQCWDLGPRDGGDPPKAGHFCHRNGHFPASLVLYGRFFTDFHPILN